MPNLAKIAIFRKLRQVEVSACDMSLGIYLKEVFIFSKSFEIFECQNPKKEEISLPFSGEGTKMAYLEFKAKNAKIGENEQKLLSCFDRFWFLSTYVYDSSALYDDYTAQNR